MKKILTRIIAVCLIAAISAGNFTGCFSTTGTSSAPSTPEKISGDDNSGDELSGDESGDSAEDNSDGSEGSENSDGSDGSEGSDSSEGSDGSEGSENSDGSDGSEGSDSSDGSDSSEGSDSSDGSDNSEGSESTDAPESSETPESTDAPDSSEAPESSDSTESTGNDNPPPPASSTTTVQTAPPETTTTEAPQTTPPASRWLEEEVNLVFYTVADCHTKSEPLSGAPKISLLKMGTKVLAVAKTNTGHYKLADGSYLHESCLSTEPVATTPVQTTPPATTPVETEPPVTRVPTNPDLKPEDFKSPDGKIPSVIIDKGVSVLTDIAVNCTKEEEAVFNMVNAERKKKGLQPLLWDTAAYEVAKTRSVEIVTSFTHERPNGESPYTLYKFTLWDYVTRVGENIAAGQKTPEEVMSSWMDSAPHKKNILKSDFASMAIAMNYDLVDKYHYYWVQEFTTYRDFDD